MWNNENEINFLELYQIETILWDPNHRFHKDKKYIYDAWVRISEQTGFSVPELKKKKDSLMATYRGHLRKIKNSLKSGAGSDEVYKPVWFAFDLMNSFLENLYECKKTRNTENHNTQPQKGTGANPDHTYHITIEPDEHDNTGDNDTRDLEPPSFVSTPTQRRSKNPPELNKAEKNMNDAIINLNKVINSNRVNPTPPDDCDLYGKMLASKLRSLSSIDRLQLMHEIDGLYLKKIINTQKIAAATKYSPYPCFSPRFDSSCSSYSEPLMTEIRVRRPSSSYSLPGRSTYSSTPPPVLHIPESPEFTPITIQNMSLASQQLPKSNSITILSDETFELQTPQQSGAQSIVDAAYYRAMQ